MALYHCKPFGVAPYEPFLPSPPQKELDLIYISFILAQWLIKVVSIRRRNESNIEVRSTTWALWSLCYSLSFLVVFGKGNGYNEMWLWYLRKTILGDFTESSRSVKPAASHFSHQALINSGKDIIMPILPYLSVFPPATAPWDLLFADVHWGRSQRRNKSLITNTQFALHSIWWCTVSALVYTIRINLLECTRNSPGII